MYVNTFFAKSNIFILIYIFNVKIGYKKSRLKLPANSFYKMKTRRCKKMNDDTKHMFWLGIIDIIEFDGVNFKVVFK